ncbi:MBOAT family O-acyltransferase [Rubinisphaera sp. JC750]|uniref:MBOAT family O-acyltransferase n=1 Tax=Rubinisphaera sp. JC750 TaxID=2898658 RepID=UPI001F334C5D|nr:MBOAT family O-acyltransferase [Rubinisphaera sp. JC750]
MLFNSFAFWLFFLVVGLLYHRLPHRRQNVLLLIASYFFYGCWDYRFLSLIVLSTLIDYAVALGIQTARGRRKKRLLLTISLCSNLGILAFFKYYGFFAAELDTLFHTIGIPMLLPTLQVVLPVGISFYTFQTMSYTIDVYRGDCKPTRDLLDFAVYVSFFPQLVAGPIERATHFLPQVTHQRAWRPEYFREGLYLVVLGLFKKVFVADNMAVLANAIFATPSSQLTGPEVLVGVYAFAFQIYGDFSGYSAIARGVSKWLGFDLMVNFRMPYFAVDPSDFWRRWHISLSQWLRDYLYIPLGGNRHGSLFTYRNLTLTMLLGGLWHGANWTFIAWGAFHGVLLCAYRLWATRKSAATKTKQPQKLAPRLLSMLLMFHLVCISWLLFRAETIAQAGSFAWLMATNFAWTPLATMMLGMVAFYAGPLLLFEAWLEFRGELESLLDVGWVWRGLAYSYALLMCFCFPPPAAATFIYFQF